MKYHIIASLATLLITLNIYSQQKTIKLVTTDWEPYFGKNLKEQGHFSKICKTAFERVGYKMTVDFLPWKRAMFLTKEKKKYDGILGIYHKKEREKFFKYTDPIDNAILTFVSKRKYRINYKKLTDLKLKNRIF